MPPGLPVLPGVRLAARYVPARTESEGDGGWLDAVMVPHEVIALMAGRAGRRLERPGAAARLRPALREMMLAGAGPAEALAHIGDLAGGSVGARGTEACLARLDPASGEVNYASSGHLPPLVCMPGEVRFLARRGDEPAGRDGHRGAAAAPLPPGGVLLIGLGGRSGATTASHRGPADLGDLADLTASVMASNGSPAVAETADRLCAAAADWLTRGSQGRWQLGDTPGSGRGWAGGRGLSVISQVTDEVSIAPSPTGTMVVMRRRVHHPVSVGPAARQASAAG